jgi:pentatricopeptide repeat protein
MKAANIEPNHGIYVALLNRATDYDSARTVINEMKAADIEPNHGTYQYLLHRASDYATARSIIDEMKTAGIEPISLYTSRQVTVK